MGDSLRANIPYSFLVEELPFCGGIYLFWLSFIAALAVV